MPIISSGQITITDLNDGYTLSITGGNRTFSYASSGTTPAPATSGTFGFTLFRGGTSITPSAYSWTASGVLSGTSTTSTFQPTLSNTYSVATPTTVTLTVTHEGNSLTTTVSVLVSQAPSNAIIDTIFVSAPAIYKDVADAATTGTYTTTTIQGKRYNGDTTSNFGWITVTPNTTGTESARTDTSTTALTLTPTTTSGVSSYIIKLYAAASGGTAVTSQTLNVVFKGAAGSPGSPGTNGTSPTLYELGLSAAVIARSSSNVLAPTSLVVSGFSTTAGTKSAYSGRFKIYEDAVLKYTSSADQTTYTYTPTVGTIGLLKTELYAAGGTTTLLDTQEVPVVVSGSSAMTFSLTNSAYPIPADNAGAVATYVGSGTNIQVLEGSDLYTYVTTLGTTAKTFSIGTPTLSVANAITVGARSGATTTTAVVAQHSAMSNSVEAVVISYPLTYIRANGATGTQTVTQTVTKVKSGTLGIRGSRQLYSTDAAYVSTYDFDGAGAITAGADSYAARATQLIAAATAGSNPTTPINGDTVTFTNGTNYVYTITHNGTAWIPPGTILDGSLLVTGSVTAGKINSNGLEVRDGSGKLLLGSGGLTMQGLSGNFLRNSGFEDGIAGHSVGYYNTVIAPGIGWNLNAQYNLKGQGLGYITVPGAPTINTVFDYRIEQLAVTPNTRYEASALLNCHRCEGAIHLVWLDINYAYITEVAGNAVSFSSEVYTLSDLRLSGVFATSPVNAAYCQIQVRSYVKSTDPYSFIKNVYFGLASAAQTDPTPYSPGRGLGQITAANASTYIANAAIGSAQIGSLALTGTNNFSVKSATAGARMEMDSRAIKVYDASGVLRVQIGDLTA